MVTVDRQLTTQRQPASVFENPAWRTKYLVDGCDPISLSEMARVSLLDRVDTKYIFGVSQLYEVLPRLAGHYRVLEIEGMSLNRYQTVYFDTSDFWLYRQHHNGSNTRYKVRTRRYVDSDLNFFEIKHKTGFRTVKTRFQIPKMKLELDRDADEFVVSHTPLKGDQLEPKLWNQYMRTTLVSKHRQERLTIDINLAFGWGNMCMELPGIVIAEVKQERLSMDSEFIQQMRALGIHPTSFSKYCMGACMLYDDLKSNNFKPNLRQVQKVLQGELVHDFVH
ncbi:MAG: polyphosphate polymerase domain-containing protein [Anaerolineae bacterium]|nr:polyphosphate polymerase domain-containing protein [Anaerolineae bacterium]